jgi:hypothetical protein
MKQITLLLTLCALVSCTKEYSREKVCGKVVYIDLVNAHVNYNDGTTGILKKDSSYFIGKEICKP